MSEKASTQVSMQIGEKPQFKHRYYNPKAKKYSRTSELYRLLTVANYESETESKRNLKQSKGMTYDRGHLIKVEEPEDEVIFDLRRPVLGTHRQSCLHNN